MTTQNRFIPWTRKSEISKLSRPETLITSSSNRDWDSLIGLLLMLSLTGLATVSMVVDVSILRQAFKRVAPSPQEGQQQIAEQPIIQSFPHP